MSTGMLATLWRHRALTWELTKREFTGRYRGTFGGVVWSFAHPLFLLAVYTVAFGHILQLRWPGTESTIEYALTLYAGLLVFNAFSEVLSKSATLITSNPNFVKKVIFPLDLLPLVTVATAIAHMLMGVAVWFLGHLVFVGWPGVHALQFPLIIGSFVPLLLGLAWLLAAIGVVVRDIHQATTMLGHTLLFLTPLFYSIEAAPRQIQGLLQLNPLTFVVEQLRSVLLRDVQAHWSGLLLYFGAACAFAWLGLFVFRRLRPAFADLV